MLLSIPVWANRAGEGIVVAHTGAVDARYLSGPIHEGRYETTRLFQGAAVTERTRITTGSDGNACIVLTPGALLHVTPDTELTINRLRHSADGLPRTEDDIVRRIEIEVARGRIYINGGVPTPSLRINVRTDAGVIESNGAVFSLVREARSENWSVHSKEHEVYLVAPDGERIRLDDGQYGRVTPEGASAVPALEDESRHEFKLCAGYFRDVEQFLHPTRGFDRQGVSQYVGLSGPPIFIGAQGLVADVSPSFRPTTAGTAATAIPPSQRGPDGRRWSDDRIWAWWDEIGVVRGVNYVPRNCVNSMEIWMEDTFDPDIIDEELGWAKGLGYTTVRVQLQFEVWMHDPDGFLDRFDQFLDIADRNGLTVSPILFDDMNRANREPTVGPQPDPEPGRHNSQWVPSLGASRVKDMAQWADLERFTRAVVDRHKRDRRVLYWDLYNMAGNSDLWEESLPLMDQVFNWVRDIDPSQPLAVAAWREFGSPMAARKLERSDIITFSSFDNAELMEAKINLLKRYERPLVVADWLMRQRENTFESILPIYAQHGVGWFNRGLVQGRTQTWVQDEPYANPDAPDIWQHDVLKPDGTPYDEKEAQLIQEFRYLDRD